MPIRIVEKIMHHRISLEHLGIAFLNCHRYINFIIAATAVGVAIRAVFIVSGLSQQQRETALETQPL